MRRCLTYPSYAFTDAGIYVVNRYGDLLELTLDDGDGELHRMSQERHIGWQVERNDWPPEIGSTGKGTRSLTEKPVIHTNFKEGEKGLLSVLLSLVTLFISSLGYL